MVKDVALETKVDQILADTDVGQLDKSIAGKRAVKMPSPLLVSRSCVDIAFLQVFEWNFRESLLISRSVEERRTQLGMHHPGRLGETGKLEFFPTKMREIPLGCILSITRNKEQRKPIRFALSNPNKV